MKVLLILLNYSKLFFPVQKVHGAKDTEWRRRRQPRVNTDNQCNNKHWILSRSGRRALHTNTYTTKIQIHTCNCARTQTRSRRKHKQNRQMVRGQNWSLLLREEVTFLMLITKFSCQTELFPQSLKEQRRKERKYPGEMKKKGGKWQAERREGRRRRYGRLASLRITSSLWYSCFFL